MKKRFCRVMRMLIWIQFGPKWRQRQKAQISLPFKCAFIRSLINKDSQTSLKNSSLNAIKNIILDKKEVQNAYARQGQQAELKPLSGSSYTPLSYGIPYSQQDYFELMDWTGRVIRSDKRGSSDDQLSPILKRLGIESESWIESVTQFQKHFFDVAETMISLNEYQAKQNQRREKQKMGASPIEWIKGKSVSLSLYG